MIDVRQRHISGGFASAHSYIAHFDMQAKGNGVEASNFRVSASDALDFRDRATPNQILKRVGRDIPEPRDQAQDAGSGEDRKSTRLNSSHRCISYAVFCL